MAPEARSTELSAELNCDCGKFVHMYIYHNHSASEFIRLYRVTVLIVQCTGVARAPCHREIGHLCFRNVVAGNSHSPLPLGHQAATANTREGPRSGQRSGDREGSDPWGAPYITDPCSSYPAPLAQLNMAARAGATTVGPGAYYAAQGYHSLMRHNL